MTSQISDPCCDSDIKPDPFKRIVWENHVHLQITSSLKIFLFVRRNKIWLVSIMYILNKN